MNSFSGRKTVLLLIPFVENFEKKNFKSKGFNGNPKSLEAK
jgi:hypothetical protein